MDIFDLAKHLSKDLTDMGFEFEISPLDDYTPMLKVWRPRPDHKEDGVGFHLRLEQLRNLFKLWFETGGYIIHHDNEIAVISDQRWIELYVALKHVVEGGL